MTKNRLNLRNVVKIGVACLVGITVFLGCEKPEDDPNDDNGKGKPEAVMNLTATAGNGQVSLSWDVPTDNGGSEITGYEVTMDNWTNKVTKTASERSHTYTSLTNGTEYTFKVRAVNANGAGTESTATATPTVTVSGTLGDWTLPTNLKITMVYGNVTHIVTKIGNDYLSEVNSPDEPGLYYLKCTGSTWIFYEKENSGVWDNIASFPESLLAGQLHTTLFYSFFLSGRESVKNRPVIGNTTFLGRPAHIRNAVAVGDYIIDNEHCVILKITNQIIGMEVTEWDETITSFGGVNLP